MQTGITYALKLVPCTKRRDFESAKREITIMEQFSRGRLATDEHIESHTSNVSKLFRYQFVRGHRPEGKNINTLTSKYPGPCFALLLMTYANGGSLSSFLKKNRGNLTLDDVTHIAT